MSANINHPNLPVGRLLFADRNSALTFFNGFTVPSATNAKEGSVKKAAEVNYAVPALVTEFFNLPIEQEDGSVLNISVVKQDSYTALKAAFDTLAASHASLLNNLKAAGILS